MSAEVDWNEIGTLHCPPDYVIRTDPLWILVITARQGHEPPLDTLHIKMKSGTYYGPDEIEALGRRPDRKGRQ